MESESRRAKPVAATNHIDFLDNPFRRDLAPAPPHLPLGLVGSNAVANVSSVPSALPRGKRWGPASLEGFPTPGTEGPCTRLM